MCAWEIHLKSDKGSSFAATPCCELPLTSEVVPSEEQDFNHLLQVLQYAFLSLPSQGDCVECESLEVKAVARSDSLRQWSILRVETNATGCSKDKENIGFRLKRTLSRLNSPRAYWLFVDYLLTICKAS